MKNTKDTEREIANPTLENTVDEILNMLELCFETQEEQILEMELGGDYRGEKIVVSFNYKKNKKGKKVLN